MFWWFAPLAAAVDCEALVETLAAAGPVCGTAVLHAAHCLERPVGRPAPVIAASPPSGGKEIRNAYAEVSRHETENFAIWWGAETAFGPGHVTVLGDDLEHAWSAHGDFGYLHPWGSDTHKFNVYIGNTGAGPPEVPTVSGYFSYDPEGWPLVVINDFVVGSDAALTAAHELHHAVQDAYDAYLYEGSAAWYTEATATWMSGRILPDDPTWIYPVAGIAARPELSVNAFAYPGPDAGIESMHQYGASLFVEHLTRHVADDELIRASWEEGAPGDNPLEVLDRLLAAHDADIRGAWTDYALRNATWDYAQEELIEGVVDAMAAYVGDFHLPTGTVSAPTAEDVRPVRWLPQSFGANYWQLVDRPAQLEVSFAAEAPGDWAVWVVAQRGAEHLRFEVPLVDGEGTAEVGDLRYVAEAWLVVAVAGDLEGGGSHPYRFALDAGGVGQPSAPEYVNPRDAAGRTSFRPDPACACASGGGHGSAAWLVGLLGWVAAARRRVRGGRVARPPAPCTDRARSRG